jgi:hypothetical membrane protein
MNPIDTKLTQARIPVLCGVIAPVWFLVALLAFASLRPDYSHLTKAVSELGVVGAPNALAWNLLGFGAVGALICVVAWGLWTRCGFRLAALFIALSGLGFAATGAFPADMSNMQSSATQRHILASLVSFGAFVAAVPAVGWSLWTTRRRSAALAATAFGIAAILSVLLRETDMPSGLAQRINFVAYLLWIALVAIAVAGPGKETSS